ncbi:hypothetical protein AK830_g4614 [Neonectria ditissima]|uniref:Uncharacterized protein n=1 Tax=Neonectria ditissima TaxID=78410 RepID=A0A0N8H7J0_9HYPO|nr:hypothetical protein AK830_g4614 [Neonectria ditissima]
MPLVITSPSGIKSRRVTVSDASSDKDPSSYSDTETDEEDLYDDDDDYQDELPPHDGTSVSGEDAPTPKAPKPSQRSQRLTAKNLAATKPLRPRAYRGPVATETAPTTRRTSTRRETPGNVPPRPVRQHRAPEPRPAPANIANTDGYRPSNPVPPHGNHMIPYSNSANMQQPPYLQQPMQNGYAGYFGPSYPLSNTQQPQQAQQPQQQPPHPYAHMPFSMGTDGMYTMYNGQDAGSSQPPPPPPPPPPNRAYPVPSYAPYQESTNALYHPSVQPPPAPQPQFNLPPHFAAGQAEGTNTTQMSAAGERAQLDSNMMGQLMARLTKIEEEVESRKTSEESLKREMEGYQFFAKRGQDTLSMEVANARREAEAATKRRHNVEQQWAEQLDRRLERERQTIKAELKEKLEAEREEREAYQEAREEARELRRLEKEVQDKRFRETLQLNLETQAKRATEAEGERARLTTEVEEVHAEMDAVLDKMLAMQTEMQAMQTETQAIQATLVEEAQKTEANMEKEEVETPPSPSLLDVRPGRPPRAPTPSWEDEAPLPEAPEPPSMSLHLTDSEDGEMDNVSDTSREMDEVEERRMLRLMREEIVEPIVSALSGLAKGPKLDGIPYQVPPMFAPFSPYPPYPDYGRGSPRSRTSSYTETESEDDRSVASRRHRRSSRRSENRRRSSQPRVVVPELNPGEAKSSSVSARIERIEERAAREEGPGSPPKVVNHGEAGESIESTPVVEDVPEGILPDGDDDEYTWVNSETTEQPVTQHIFPSKGVVSEANANEKSDLEVQPPKMVVQRTSPKDLAASKTPRSTQPDEEILFLTNDHNTEKPRRNAQDLDHSRNTGRYFMADFKDHMAMPDVYRRGRVNFHGKNSRHNRRFQLPIMPHAFYPMPYFPPTYAEMPSSRGRRRRGGDEDVD